MFLMLLGDVLDLIDVLLEAQVLESADDVFCRDCLFSLALGNVVGFG